MSIAQTTPEPVKAPHTGTGTGNGSPSPSAHHMPTTSPATSPGSPGDLARATLKAAARDMQVTRAALAVLIELATPTNAWQSFTVTHLATALQLSRETVSRALRQLTRLHYLEERNVHRAQGERQARLAAVTPGVTPGVAR